MKDKVRRDDARLRAEAYAPAPRDSRLLYGTIAVVLALLGLLALGEFYGVNVWQQPWMIMVLAGLAALGGLLFRLRQARQHKVAHRREYELGEKSGEL